jgi:hypothetical protein
LTAGFLSAHTDAKKANLAEHQEVFNQAGFLGNASRFSGHTSSDGSTTLEKLSRNQREIA